MPLIAFLTFVLSLIFSFGFLMPIVGDKILWIGPLISIFIPVFVVIIGEVRDKKKWKSWPSVEQYLLANPSCNSGNGIKCCYCGSKNIWNLSWTSRTDRLRIHRCNQCSKYLYRTSF